jgi:tRNA threonylcarbamoyladenosine biosynthesis protein TsaE
MKITFTLEEINSVVQRILSESPNKTILFNGAMGVGKTTFIKALTKELGVEEATSSPTFSIVNEYQTNTNQTIYHFDFYRIKNETEALDMGIEDYLYSGNWCFIEWSEKIINLIPESHSLVTLTFLADGKRLLEMN